MGMMWECDRCSKLETAEMVEVKIPHFTGIHSPVDSLDFF